MFLGDSLFLALRLSTKYVESAWLGDRPGGGELRDLRMRHLLYHMGHRWFPVQLIGAHGKSISEARFTPEGEAPTDVYGYTISKTKKNPPNWIRGLAPDSPAILYRYPGKSVQRYGAAALCKLMLGTIDPRGPIAPPLVDHPAGEAVRIPVRDRRRALLAGDVFRHPGPDRYHPPPGRAKVLSGASDPVRWRERTSAWSAGPNPTESTRPSSGASG